MDRRNFIAMGGAALSASRVLGANDRIRVGLIGAGGRGRSVTKFVPQAPNAEVVAVADVYTPRRDEAVASFGGPARAARDYRDILDRKDVDAVVIATPDHWHTPMTLLAVSAGKDVYMEKPVTHTIEEGPKLIEGVESSGRVVATGTQQRSWDHYLKAKDLVTGGALGKLSIAQCYWYQNYGQLNSRADFKSDIDTSKLDWNMWLGDARKQPFDPIRYRYWRFFHDFGGGNFTDLMTHWIDVVQWYMDTPEPDSVQAAGETAKITEFELPDTVTASLHFPKNYMVVYYGSLTCGLGDGGIVFRGDKAMMQLTRSGYRVFEEGSVKFGTTEMPVPVAEMKSTGDGTKTNVANWLDCVRSRKTPNANVRAGVAAAHTSHLANKAMLARTMITG